MKRQRTNQWSFGRLAVWPFGRLAVWPFGLAAVVGCSDYSFTFKYPDNPCCNVGVASTGPPPSGSSLRAGGERLGASLAFLTAGPSASTANDEVFVAAGSSRDAVETTTTVALFQVDPGTGRFTNGGNPVQVLSPPPLSATPFSTSSNQWFGTTMVAADIIECHYASSGHPIACGEELLVSASHPSRTGTVYIYVRDGSITDVGPGDAAFAFHSALRHKLANNGDLFGRHMAAAPPLRDPTDASRSFAPWVDPERPHKVAGGYSDFVAISSPGVDSAGGNTIQVFAVDPSDHANPLSFAMEYNFSPSSGVVAEVPVTGLVLGDWDDNGATDIAFAYEDYLIPVGGTGPASQLGLLTAYLNVGGATPYGTSWLSQYNAFRDDVWAGNNGSGVPGYQDQPDEFGFSLATGYIAVKEASGSKPRRLKQQLLVGAPGYAGRAPGFGTEQWGAVCGLDFAGSNTPPAATCVAPKNLASDGYPNNYRRFGTSITTANAAALDQDGFALSEAATLEEVVVGSTGIGLAGVVQILATDEDGIFIEDATTHKTGIPHAVQTLVGASTVGGFGTSLARGYGQTYHNGGTISSRWEDVVVGIPGATRDSIPFSGRIALTEAGGTMACEETHGYWAEDSAGDASIRLCTSFDDDSMRLTFIDSVDLFMEDGFGALCEAEFNDGTGTGTTTEDAFGMVPAGTSFILPAPWDCPDTADTITSSIVESARPSAKIFSANGKNGKAIDRDDLIITVDYDSSADEITIQFDVSAWPLWQAGLSGCNFAPIVFESRRGDTCE